MQAVITGCNRGLGEGIARVLLEKEWNVIGLNRTSANNLGYSGYIDYVIDVSNKEDVGLCFLKNDKVDLLVINAGVRRFNNIENMPSGDWEDSVNINLNGAFYVTKKMLPYVKKAKGDIVIIGSHSEKYTFESGAAYCSTKGALREFAECLMQEVRYDDVRVSYLSLGSIKNRDHGGDESWKLKPTDVGETIYSLIQLPKNIMIPYVDVRPSKPLRDLRPGIEKLQYV